MSGRIATNSTRELIPMVDTISSDGMALSQLIMYKGVAHYMAWSQHLDSLINMRKDWKFIYSKTGWNNSFLTVKRLEHFDNITKGWLVSTQKYRFHILDGCGIHIHIDFIEYCISHRIIVYCLPSHTTHLLQPLNVLFSPLQISYGKEVDRLTRFGNVAINKGNFYSN